MNMKNFVKQAVIGFSFWTLVLTPYVILVTKMSLMQYITWVGMNAILVTPLAPIGVRITNKLVK